MLPRVHRDSLLLTPTKQNPSTPFRQSSPPPLVHNEPVIRSARQREASRLNGARSRGPVTAAGKRHSSRNSLRHGLYSQTASPLLSVPSGAPLDALRAAYQPRTPHTEHLVIQAAIASWRVRQLQTLDAATMNAEIARQRMIHPLTTPAQLTALAFRRLVDETGTLQLILRLEGSFRPPPRPRLRPFGKRPSGKNKFCRNEPGN